MSPATRVALVAVLLGGTADILSMQISMGGLAHAQMYEERRESRPMERRDEGASSSERREQESDYRQRAIEQMNNGARSATPQEDDFPGRRRRQGGGNLVDRIRGLGAAVEGEEQNGAQGGVREPLITQPPPASGPTRPPASGPPVVTAGQPVTVAPKPGTTVTGFTPGSGTSGMPLILVGLGGAVLGGLGGLLFGIPKPVGIRIVRRCDCSTFQESVRRRMREIAQKEAEIAAARAWIKSANAAMASWSVYETDLLAWLDAFKDFWAKLQAAIASWKKYIALLESLMGPVAIAGRNKYDNHPHEGWVKVAEGFWANSEEAAQAARMSYQASQMLAGGLMAGPKGLKYYGALAIAEQKLAAAESAEFLANLQSQHVNQELRKCRPNIEALATDIGKRELVLKEDEAALPGMRLGLDMAMRELNECLSAEPPHCPVGAPEYNEYEISEFDGAIAQPDGGAPGTMGQLPDSAPAIPGEGPDDLDESALDGLMEGAAVTGGATTVAGGKPPQEKPAPKAPPPPAAPPATVPKSDATFLLSDAQRQPINDKVRERGEIRTQIREIEAKSDQTAADKKKLVELKEEERALSTNISNSIARSHNENVQTMERERAEEERQATGSSTLDPKDVEKVEKLTQERDKLAGKPDPTPAERSRIAELNSEITEAKADAVKNARPVTVEKPALEFDQADTDKIARLDEDSSKLRDDIAGLEEKQKTGSLDAGETRQLEESRTQLKTLDEEKAEATKTAEKNALTREQTRLNEQAARQQTEAKKPVLTPADRERLSEKNARLEATEKQLADYWTRSQAGTLAPADKEILEGLKTQYQEQLDDVARDFVESESRGKAWQKEEIARRDAEASRPRTIEEQYEAAKTAQPVSLAAQRAMTEARRQTEALQAESARANDRITVLKGLPTRTPEQDAELSDLQQKVMGDIPGKISSVWRDTMTKFPELAPQKKPAPPQPPASTAAATEAPAAEPPSKTQVRKSIEGMKQEVETWLRSQLHIADASHPLVELVMAIAVNLGPDGLTALLAGTRASDPLNALVEIVLLASDKLPAAGSLALFENVATLLNAQGDDDIKRLWGSQPVTNDRQTRFMDRYSALALQSGALGPLANALELLATRGQGTGATAGKLKDTITELFPQQFDVTQAIAAFEASTAALPQKAAQLAGLISRLRKLADLTGSTVFKPALDALTAQTGRVARQLEMAAANVTSVTHEAGKAEDANRALIARLEDVGLKGMTAADIKLFDTIADGWRDWLGHENFMQRTGEYAARHIVRALYERQTRLAADTSRAANQAAAFDRLRLDLLTGNLPAGERTATLKDAFAEALKAVDAYEKMMMDTGVTGVTEAHMAVLRAKAESRQAQAFAGDHEGVVGQLDDIRKEIVGWDEHREIYGHTMGETIHHEGLREKLYRLEKEQEERESREFRNSVLVSTSPGLKLADMLVDTVRSNLVGVAPTESDLARREIRLLRDRIGYLQQRRVDLMLADPRNFNFASLQAELQRDAIYWEHRKPWKELAWLSSDKTSEAVWQQTLGAKLHELPMLAWQMSSAQNNPQSFMAFLLQLQDEKMRGGNKAWEDNWDMPWWRRGAGTQSDRLAHSARIMDEMYATDMRLRTALAGGAAVSVDKLPADLRETLREHGFVVTGSDDKDHYAVPKRFHWDALGVLETKAQRDTSDEILNLSNVAQLASTYMIGGWAGQLGRSFQLTEGVYAGWMVFGSRVAIEATAFMAAETAMHGGNIFSLLVGKSSLKDFGKEWLLTAITIGGLQYLAPWLEAMEHTLQGKIPKQDMAKAWQALWETRSAKTLVSEAFSNIAERSIASGARLTADLVFMSSVNAIFGEKITVESLGRTVFMLGVMRTSGVLGEARARELYREASKFGRLITRAQQNYEAKTREVFEEAKADGRTELNDHERAVLDAARQQLTVATGKIDLTREFRDIEKAVGTKLAVQMGEARGAWRDVVKSEAKQREILGGKTLLEALHTRDGKDGDPFEVRYRTALRAAARFMHEAGSWVGTKQEMFRDHPEVAKALFEVRKAWAEWIKKNYSASVIGTVSDMRNDCDFNFALGEGEAFNPVPRMQAAKAWTKSLVRDLLIEAGLTKEQADAADHEILFETNSYTDPGIIHLYTRLPPELQAGVIRTLTADSIGLAQYWVKHHLGALPADITVRAMRDLAYAARESHVRTPDEVAAELGIRDWDTPAGNDRLYAEQNRLFGEYAKDPNNPAIVEQICEIQMLINSRAQGAYITPGAALVTVSIKEGKLSPEMRDIKKRLEELKAGEQTAEVKEDIGALERSLEEIRLDQIKNLSVDEALQSVIGDMVFFWHIAEEASRGAQAFDVVMRYEFSKYVARLLEVARVHGMDPTAGVPGDFRFLGIAKLLKIATRIYKGKKPGEVFAGEYPALAGLGEMRDYLEAVQHASGDVVRYLLERSSAAPKVEEMGDWLAPPERGPHSDSPASAAANLHLVNLLASESLLTAAKRGGLSAAPNVRAMVARNYEIYVEALAGIRDGLHKEGPNYWEHFDPDAAALVREKLASWDHHRPDSPPQPPPAGGGKKRALMEGREDWRALSPDDVAGARPGHMYGERERVRLPGEVAPSIQTGPQCAPTSIADVMTALSGRKFTAQDVIDAAWRACAKDIWLEPPTAKGWMTRETRQAAARELGFEALDASFQTAAQLKALTQAGELVVSVHTIRGGAHAMRVLDVEVAAPGTGTLGKVTLADTNPSRVPGQGGGRIVELSYEDFFQQTREGASETEGYAMLIRKAGP